MHDGLLLLSRQGQDRSALWPLRRSLSAAYDVGLESAIMFGMLDYRAHKLYWLLTRPFAVAAKVSFYGAVLGSILIAEQLAKSAALKIIVAFFAMEVIGGSVFLLWWLVLSAIKKLFFFFVDIVPAHGSTAEEAKLVASEGDLFLLTEKLANRVEDWTDEDTRRYVSLDANWRARMFFHARERFTHVVNELKRIHQETGKEPNGIEAREIETLRESAKGGHVTLLEKIIVPQHHFNSLVGLIIIIFVVLYVA
jgi:hypothetical protein